MTWEHTGKACLEVKLYKYFIFYWNWVYIYNIPFNKFQVLRLRLMLLCLQNKRFETLSPTRMVSACSRVYITQFKVMLHKDMTHCRHIDMISWPVTFILTMGQQESWNYQFESIGLIRPGFNPETSKTLALYIMKKTLHNYSKNLKLTHPKYCQLWNIRNCRNVVIWQI